ncbi:putative porin [Sandaracinobacter sp. RS1-74]|uniref:putative porin n=1 Tax=Sandaracinobacteroides sayramensis TaxID=2913411 RepID=UPI001EDC83D2|nr:putative porin [Sandaracinobacteroides sayramensis]MCG2839426.1 putative porin [Sandaracinobacteroides sayramensis]
MPTKCSGRYPSAHPLLSAAAAMVLASIPTGAFAQSDPSTRDILNILVEKGVLSRGDADGVLAEARRRTEAAEGTVRAPYVPEAVRDQIREEVKADVLATAKSEGWAQPGALPDWVGKLDIHGDVRVRAEHIAFGKANTPLIYDINAINADGGYYVDDVLPLRETTENRFRARIRARLGFEARLSDKVDVGFRLATGNLNDPVSANITMSDNFHKLTVGLDRAYIRVRPFASEGDFAQSNLVFGKFDNPFRTTELIFDEDIQFEGFAATLDTKLGDSASAPHVRLTAGVFPMEEWDFSNSDKYLYAAQLGIGGAPLEGFRFNISAGYFDFANVQGQFNTPGTRDHDHTAASRVQFGNSVFNLRNDPGIVNTVLFGLASKFRVGALNAEAEFDLNPTLVGAVNFEIIKNFGFSRRALTERQVPNSSGDMGWYLRGSIGHAKVTEANAWNFNAGYRRLEADSTLDLFADSDFGLGGTDQKGFVVQGSYGLAKNLWMRGSWYSARTINLKDPATNLVAPPIDTDTVMFDLNARF